MSSNSPDFTPVSRVLRAVCYLALAALLTLIIVARSVKLREIAEYDQLLTSILLASLAVSLAGWIVIIFSFRRVVTRIGNEGLAIIGLFAGLQFVVSFAARIADSAIYMLTGPLAPFIAGLGDEGLRCLLLATLVTILPRPGTLMLSTVTVSMLNAIVTGNLNMSVLLFVTVGIVAGEATLAILGVTTGRELESPCSKPDGSIVVRIALAIGLANGVKLFLQFCLSYVVFRMWYGNQYIAAVAISGFIYGAIGGALGTLIGFRLRRTAR